MSVPSTDQSADFGFLDGSSLTVPFRMLVPSLNASHLPAESMTTVNPLISSAPDSVPSRVCETASQVPTSFFRSFSASSATTDDATTSATTALNNLIETLPKWNSHVPG